MCPKRSTNEEVCSSAVRVLPGIFHILVFRHFTGATARLPTRLREQSWPHSPARAFFRDLGSVQLHAALRLRGSCGLLGGSHAPPAPRRRLFPGTRLLALLMRTVRLLCGLGSSGTVARFPIPHVIVTVLGIILGPTDDATGEYGHHETQSLCLSLDERERQRDSNACFGDLFSKCCDVVRTEHALDWHVL